MSHHERPAWLGDIIDALHAERDSMWATGDALVRRINHSGGGSDYHNGAAEQVRNIQRHLADAGEDVSESVLHARYVTSAAFPVESRHPNVSWTVHRLLAEVGMADAPQRLHRFLLHCQDTGVAASRRQCEVWLNRKPAADSAEAVGRKVADDPAAAREIVAEVARQHPEVVADVAVNQTTVETNRKQEERRQRETPGARDPRDIDRDREDERLAKYGAGFVEVLEASTLGDNARELARKFVTPEDGRRYNDNAVTVVEAAAAKMRAAADHMVAVVRGEFDTRVPDSLEGLVSE